MARLKNTAKFALQTWVIVCRFSFHSETVQCNNFQSSHFAQLLHFKGGNRIRQKRVINRKS